MREFSNVDHDFGCFLQVYVSKSLSYYSQNFLLQMVERFKDRLHRYPIKWRQSISRTFRLTSFVSMFVKSNNSIRIFKQQTVVWTFQNSWTGVKLCWIENAQGLDHSAEELYEKIEYTHFLPIVSRPWISTSDKLNFQQFGKCFSNSWSLFSTFLHFFGVENLSGMI